LNLVTEAGASSIRLYITPRKLVVTHEDGKKRRTDLAGPEQETATLAKFNSTDFRVQHHIASIEVKGDNTTYQSDQISLSQPRARRAQSL
jgi:hypothetical protein